MINVVKICEPHYKWTKNKNKPKSFNVIVLYIFAPSIFYCHYLPYYHSSVDKFFYPEMFRLINPCFGILVFSAHINFFKRNKFNSMDKYLKLECLNTHPDTPLSTDILTTGFEACHRSYTKLLILMTIPTEINSIP